MSEMLAQLPMIQTTMQVGAEAENQLFQTAELNYLVAEEGQGFFDEVNTDQEAVLLNDNSTEEEQSLLNIQINEASDESEQVPFKALSNKEKIITVHTPIKTASFLKVKPPRTNENEMHADAATIEIPIIQHNELFIQERTSHAQIKLETQTPRKEISIPQEMKQALSFLSKETEAKIDKPTLSSFKSEIKIADLKVENPSINIQEKSDPALPQITLLPKIKQTSSLLKTNKAKQSEEQITEQVSDQKKPSLKNDLVSPRPSQKNPQKQITDLANEKPHDSQTAEKTDHHIFKISEKNEHHQTTHPSQQKITLQTILAPQANQHIQKHATPTQQVAIKLIQSVKSKDTHFKIIIKPHGTIEVEAKLSFDKDGNIKVHLKTESIETLNDLKKDMHHLEKTLVQAGFDKQQQNFEFDLKEQSKDDHHHQANNQDQSQKENHQNKEANTESLNTHPEESEEYDLQSTGLNIEI